MTVNQLTFYHTVMSIYKMRKTKEPEYLYQLISKENRANNITIDQTNLTLARKGFIFRGTENWNSIPQNIRKAETVSSFKKQVKTWIFDNVKFFPE